MKLNFTIPLLPLLLAIIFMILKLCGIIAWSWFWIASPIILPIIIAIGLFLLFSLLIIAYKILNEIYIYIKTKKYKIKNDYFC